MKISSIHFLGSFEKYQEAANHKPEIALIGRSNVGKSSLINAFLGRKKMAHISSKPGKTKRLNYFLVNKQFCLVDMPGYGWAQVSQKERAHFSALNHDYLAKSRSLYLLLVLIDVRLAPQPIDQDFILKLADLELPFAVVFTKQDKVGKSKRAQHIKLFKKFLAKYWDPLPPTFLTSSLKGEGIINLRAHLASTLAPAL